MNLTSFIPSLRRSLPQLIPAASALRRDVTVVDQRFQPATTSGRPPSIRRSRSSWMILANACRKHRVERVPPFWR
jgi:hypothetical protein